MYGIALILTQIPRAAGLFPADRYSCASLAGVTTVAVRLWRFGTAGERGIPAPHPYPRMESSGYGLAHLCCFVLPAPSTQYGCPMVFEGHALITPARFAPVECKGCLGQ